MMAYNPVMELHNIAILLRPFVVLALCFFILLPVRFAVIKWMPEGRLKRFLLIRVTK
jgi:hypothetical protein